MTPPSIPHTALFIYSESFAQSEDGRRFHVFARLEDSDRWVIFYTRDMRDQQPTVWHQHELDPSLATQIKDTFGTLKIPLSPAVRDCNDLLYLRSLEMQVQGSTLYVGWDTGDSALADALSPLLNLLLPLVNEMKTQLEASDL